MFKSCGSHYSLATSILSLLLIAGAYADDTNEFTIPGPPGGKFNFDLNPIWPMGSDTILRWKTDWSKVSLALWQYGNGSSQTLLDKVDAQYRYEWTVDLKGLFGLEDGDMFLFTVYNAAGEGQFDSHYVNITDDSSNPSGSTTISSSVTESPTGSSSPNTDSDSSAAPSGLSMGATIGIGVGAGVGGVLLLGLVAVLLFRRRLKRSRQSHMKPAMLPPSPPGYRPLPTEYAAYKPAVPVARSQDRTSQPQQQSPQELPPEGLRAELGIASSQLERQELPGDHAGTFIAPSRFGWQK